MAVKIDNHGCLAVPALQQGNGRGNARTGSCLLIAHYSGECFQCLDGVLARSLGHLDNKLRPPTALAGAKAHPDSVAFYKLAHGYLSANA
jgi:hypothetical protein